MTIDTKEVARHIASHSVQAVGGGFLGFAVVVVGTGIGVVLPEMIVLCRAVNRVCRNIHS